MLPTHYVPVLTGKLGELEALSHLPAGARMNVTPLIDVPPVPRPRPPKLGEEPSPPTPPERPLARLLMNLGKLLGFEHHVLLDLDGYEAYRPNGQHPVAFAAKHSQWHDVLLRTVVSNHSSAEYIAAALASESDLSGYSVRIHVPEGSDPAATVADIERILNALHRGPEQLELVVDLGQLPDGPLDLGYVRGHLDAVPYFKRWRAVALASTSVPGSDALKQGDEERFPRRDWRLWERLREAGIEVTFADYGITGPRPQNDDPAYSPAPNLRYTTTAALLWWKGHKEEPPEGERKLEYPDLCKLLVKSGNFAGTDFSWGDAAIGSKAEGLPGTGRGQDWVAWATSHHVTAVRADLDAAG